MQRFQIAAILSGLLFASTGCATMSDWTHSLSGEKPQKSSRFAGRDDGDPGMTPGDLRKSRNSVGEEDGFQWKHGMSSEARGIEQSLGFD